MFLPIARYASFVHHRFIIMFLLGNRLQPVAFFMILDAEKSLPSCSTVNAEWPIFVDDCFYIGRNSSLCRYTIDNDRFISNRHLHVHCILFDEKSASRIPPLVYVQDCSLNGTFVTFCDAEVDELAGEKSTEQRVRRESGPFILNNGDCLRISPTITLCFKCHDSYRCQRESGLSPQQLREINVSTWMLPNGRN